MKVKKSEVVAMFQALGFASSDRWDLPRMNDKIKGLPKLELDDAEKKKGGPLLKNILAALAADKEVVAVKDEVADEKANAKKPVAVEEPEEEETETDEEEEEEEEEETDDEEDEPEPKKTETPKDKKEPKAKKVEPEPEPVVEDEEVQERPETHWRHIDTKIVKGKDLVKAAKEFAGMDHASVERPFKEARAEYYTELIANNEFRPPTWTKIKVKDTKQTIRGNGQHSSAAVVKFTEDYEDTDALDNLSAYVEEYEADTMADAVRLWSTFDSKEQARSGGDINYSFAQTIEKVKNFDHKLINLAVGALTYAHAPSNMGGGKHHTSAERAEVLLTNKSFVVWLKSVIRTKDEDTAVLWRVPVVAAMFKCWEKDKAEAKKFWEAVRDETGEVGTPERRVKKFLTGLSLKGTLATEKVVPKTVYGRMLEAWNKFRAGEKGNLTYQNKEELPEVQ